MNGWNYDLENIPEGDARKIVTLEKDGMTWVGIRAFNHNDKTWMNNGADIDERVVAWRDLPTPADPKYSAVPKEQIEAFERSMREDAIPEIERRIEDNAERVAETRHHVLFR